LKGIWYDSDVAQNDIVSVKAIWKDDRKMFIVSNEAGMIVILPDRLMSGTTVVGSLFCARKQVLAEKFKSIDSGADSKIVSCCSSLE
jgi:DNA replication ATP-dependent helicase Dna2